MIEGIGIDIIEVERVAEKILRDNGFKEKVFSKNEIEYCEGAGSNKMQHYASRFAAKEAFLKATGKGLLLSHELHEIEIISNTDGKPDIKLLGSLAKLAKENHWAFHLSMSHIKSSACSVVVIEVVLPKK
jgi:holo-[acyl-carrier protein] synthase